MKRSATQLFREIVTGRRRGVGAAVVRWSLAAAEIPYRWIVTQRNRRYDDGRYPATRLPVPVASVGNLTLGGTGKTPLVAWIAHWFRQHGLRVAIVSRGYGAGKEAVNDEARELEARLPDVPHVQHPDRVHAARIALEELESQLVLLDDGFQHRRLARDLDIVLLDATEPFGGGRVFPRGLLREPIAGLARADLIVLTRADLVSPARRDQIRHQALQQAPRAAWAEVAYRPSRLLSASGQSFPLDAWAGARVAAFCGIGNPQAFRETLTRQGWQVALFHEFPDHHRFTRSDVELLAREAHASGNVRAVLCTHKDLVKLGTDRLGSLPLLALLVEPTFLGGQTEIEDRLRRLLKQATS